MLLDHIHFAGSKERPARAVRRSPDLSRCAPSDDLEEPFLSELLRMAGLDGEAYRTKALQRRIPACLRWLRVPNPSAALERIRMNPSLVPELVSVVLLGVTEFHRDRPVFDRLALSVIPDLARRPGRLRIWSAACSDGPELYSAAFLLDRAGVLERCEILGTDCRGDALQRARLGIYSPTIIQRAELEWQTMFTPTPSGFAVPARLRRAIHWKQANLLAAVESGPWNLLLWRNMAIYLRPDAAAAVWERLAAQLAPGGYLVTGKADHPPRLRGLHKCGPSIWKRCEP
ncbi:MAG: CheR family methyltransferase [Terrimicrobiaceae bacterium]|nr:CheR family methyltransferase [Terrimicrobiaceae bacterium]